MTKEEYLQRETEIAEAVKTFPAMEMGAAYTKWKGLRGEAPVFLRTDDPEVIAIRKTLKQDATKPCTMQGCNGIMRLESICGSCVEGRKGYKSKWTCEECLHRELSRKDFFETLKEMSHGG